MWSNFYFLVQVRFNDSLSKYQKWRINLHGLLGCFELLQAHLGFGSAQAHSICSNSKVHAQSYLIIELSITVTFGFNDYRVHPFSCFGDRGDDTFK